MSRPSVFLIVAALCAMSLQAKMIPLAHTIPARSGDNDWVTIYLALPLASKYVVFAGSQVFEIIPHVRSSRRPSSTSRSPASSRRHSRIQASPIFPIQVPKGSQALQVVVFQGTDNQQLTLEFAPKIQKNGVYQVSIGQRPKTTWQKLAWWTQPANYLQADLKPGGLLERI